MRRVICLFTSYHHLVLYIFHRSRSAHCERECEWMRGAAINDEATNVCAEHTKLLWGFHFRLLTQPNFKFPFSQRRFSTLSNSSESVEKFLPPATALTTTTEAVEPEEQLGYKNVVMNFYTTPARPTPCRYMEGTKRQNHQCRRDSGLPESLFFARQLAMSHCKDQFKFDRWNCSIELRGKRNIFKKVRHNDAMMTRRVKSNNWISSTRFTKKLHSYMH